MKKLKNEDSSVQAFVTMQGVLVVQLERGQHERRVFESLSVSMGSSPAAERL
jgi:hypothetical protein